MNAKYFKTLPEQEYIFSNYYELGKKEGICCADCGTYITRVVQLRGRADGMIYNLGTTCCDKISKDRSVFLTPLSEQRKRIFMNQFKKFQKIKKELEAFAEDMGGAVLKFCDIDTDYRQNLRICLFILCGNGLLIMNSFEEAQRCFAGLKELLQDYQTTFDTGDFFEGSWKNYDSYRAVSQMVGNAYAEYNNNEFKWNNDSVWYAYFMKQACSKDWVHYEDTKYSKMAGKDWELGKYSTCIRIF